MTNEYSLLDIVRRLSKWKKQIVYATLGIALLSAIISLLLPVYYSASTTFYASNPDLASPAPLGYSDVERPIYGTDVDLDRLFSIAKSNTLYDYLIKKYDLMKHYDIDTTNVKAPYYVREELDDNFKTLKTEYGAIELSMMDTDPKRAEAMANDARDRISTIAQQVIKDSQEDQLSSLSESIKAQENIGQTVSDSIQSIKGKYQIVNSESQGEVYAELITNTTAKVLTAKGQMKYYKTRSSKRDSLRKYTAMYEAQSSIMAGLKDDLQKYNQGLSKLQKYELEYKRLIDQISLDKEKRKQLMSVMKSPISAVHVVEYAQVPVIKAKPKRSLIVLASTILGFILICLGVLFFESSSKIDWKSIWNAK